MEALRTAGAELTVYMHPSNAKRVRQLSALLFTYEDRFDGVLLAHEVAFHVGKDKEGKDKAGKPNKDESGDPKDEGKDKAGKPNKDESGEPKDEGKDKAGKPDKDESGEPKDESGEPKDESGKPKSCVKGKIMNGLVPYFGIQVHANLLLFSPQPDMILEGKVDMLGKESIHAIVLGVFSAAIMSEDIREKFKFKRKSDGGKFVSRTDKHHVIKRGTMIRFSVKSGEDGNEDTSIKIEQNEQEHRILKNEDGMVKSERPYKSRKALYCEDFV